MRNFKLGLALVVTSGLTLSAACSSDDDSGASGGGTGSSAKGGNTSGGAASKGGSGGASGGSTAKGGSGGTTGGTANAGGEPGAGGGDTNPGDCPMLPPTEGAGCDVDITFQDGGCEYGGMTCVCDEPFGGGNGGDNGQTEWICFGDGGGGAPGGGGGAPGGGGAGNGECPMDEPSGDCNGPIDGCTYGDVSCECPAFGPDEDTWVCE